MNTPSIKNSVLIKMGNAANTIAEYAADYPVVKCFIEAMQRFKLAAEFKDEKDITSVLLVEDAKFQAVSAFYDVVLAEKVPLDLTKDEVTCLHYMVHNDRSSTISCCDGIAARIQNQTTYNILRALGERCTEMLLSGGDFEATDAMYQLAIFTIAAIKATGFDADRCTRAANSLYHETREAGI